MSLKKVEETIPVLMEILKKSKLTKPEKLRVLYRIENRYRYSSK